MARRLPLRLVATLATILSGCSGEEPGQLFRVPSLLEAVGEVPPAGLPPGTAARQESYDVSTDLSAARVARLRLRARGDAPLATLCWKLEGERRFLPYRKLSFPLLGGGGEQVYEIDLQREPYWTGRVEGLRIAVDEGRLEILELTPTAPTEAYRSMSLAGETAPALPGLARIDFALPEGLPRHAAFETRLGLVPEFDKGGVAAVFRVWTEDGAGRRELWLEETVEGGGGRGAKWRRVRRELPRGARRLALEVAASRQGRPLPEGVGLWGGPIMVAPGGGGHPGEAKNLVLVVIDTLRADVLGAYGDATGITPNLDAFARGGVRFEEMLAPSPWTLPSMASLMTGLQPQTHGAGQRQAGFAPTGLTAGARTMPEVLGDAGFYNVGIYHNIYVNPAFGLQQGFDEYVSVERRAGVLVDEALERLRRTEADRRVFLYLHLFDPHTPYEPPQEECRSVARAFVPGYDGRLGCSVERLPAQPVPPRAEDRRWHEALYRAEVAATDRQIGRLLEGVEAMGIADDTIVAIVSDHGEEFWGRLEQERALGYRANSDHGHAFYRELLQVPALLRVPGRTPAVVSGPAELVDLFPTLLRLAGVAPPPSQGRDLTPHLSGRRLGRPLLLADRILHGRPRWSARRGPWKLVVPLAAEQPLELYHLERDPGEARNVAGSHPDEVAALRALGEREIAARERARSRFLGADSLGATYLEWNHITKLRSLGYL
jgi:arylsulfatase A-like enzyme